MKCSHQSLPILPDRLVVDEELCVLIRRVEAKTKAMHDPWFEKQRMDESTASRNVDWSHCVSDRRWYRSARSICKKTIQSDRDQWTNYCCLHRPERLVIG